MAKKPNTAIKEEDEMRPEYDFRDAVRGRHCRPLEKGYIIYIHQPGGTTVVKQMKLENGILHSRICRDEKKLRVGRRKS